MPLIINIDGSADRAATRAYVEKAIAKNNRRYSEELPNARVLK